MILILIDMGDMIMPSKEEKKTLAEIQGISNALTQENLDLKQENRDLKQENLDLKKQLSVWIR